MKIDVESLGVDIPEVSQVGMVVEDLDEGMEQFEAVLGVGPWNDIRFEPPELTDTTYLGKETEFSFRIAIADAGEIDLELIEPLEGENVYTDHLEEHGEGLHHIACYTLDDPQETVDVFRDAGMPVIQSGVFKGSTFWYIDTREALHGVLFEVLDRDDD